MMRTKIWEPDLLYNSVCSRVSLSFCCFSFHLSEAGIIGVFHRMEHVEFFTLFKAYFLHFFILCGCVCAIAYTWRSYYNSVGSVLPFTLQALKMWCLVASTCWATLQTSFITFGFNVYHYYFIPIFYIYIGLKSIKTKPNLLFFLILFVFYLAHSYWSHITLSGEIISFVYLIFLEQPRKSKEFMETAQIYTDVVFEHWK